MKSIYDFYAQHLHLHSCYEPGASMEGHIYHAKNLGMKYIWFTDHDIRMGRKPHEVDGFDFDTGLSVRDLFDKEYGFKCENADYGSVEHCRDTAYEGSGCMKMQVASDGDDWCGVDATLFSHGKSHCVSLLSDVSVSFAYRMDIDDPENQRLIFDFKLSERPPELTCAHILYVLGSTDGLHEKHTLVIPIESSSDWLCRQFDLSKDAEGASGGIDNVFDTVTVRLEVRCKKSAVAFVDAFKKTVHLKAQETYDKQKCVAAQIGEKYGVTPFVATEVSAAGMHKNCFSTRIPILDYESKSYNVSNEEACRILLSEGCAFSLNHPFVRYKRRDCTGLDLDAEVNEIAQFFLNNACFGATLLDVGYPDGRHNVPLSCYTKLWDKLALGGYFLTGYGCSDSHSLKSGWYSGNNFATWLGVPSGEYPDEDKFIEAMKAGRAYTANPVVVTGNISFEAASGAPMGSVCVCDLERNETIRFGADKIKCRYTLRWIVNGRIQKETPICSDTASDEIEITTSLPIEFVRAELYDEKGKLLLLTNPIYFVREDLADIIITKERIYRL